MNQDIDPRSIGLPELHVAIIGNSNSVMRGSYTRILEDTPRIKVTNRSFGSTPNVILLDFLALETNLDYDFIIVETAVVDYIQSSGLYSRDRSAETLELFVAYVRAKSRAQIIFLTIPTRYALLAPGVHWQETLYSSVATRFRIPILDGFRLIRYLIGQPKMKMVETFVARAKKLVSAFGLPPQFVESFAWGNLRDHGVASNSLGLFAFNDHAHVSVACHLLLGTMLREFICSFPADESVEHPPTFECISTCNCR